MVSSNNINHLWKKIRNKVQSLHSKTTTGNKNNNTQSSGGIRFNYNIMSNIPIVQGVNVAPQSGGGGGNNNWGYQQANEADAIMVAPGAPNETNVQRKFQDVGWSILFVAHLIGILGWIGMNLTQIEISSDNSYGNIIFLTCVAALSAIGIATLCLSWMMRNAETLVQTALFFSIGTSLAVGILGFVTGSTMMGVLGIISFAFGCCYAKLVWSRIPFAASNLKTALTAVKANLGLAGIAYAFTGIAFVWTIAWFLGLGSSLSSNALAVVFLLFVSYYWVHQVLQNTVHVTTAGVIGTWWFVPEEASSCCSRALTDSFFRATTYSFGSICFGSLLVAIIQALRALEHYTRENDDLNFVSCIIQCILGCLQAILEELTKFAYVYVGLYGFSFLDASKNVIQLFQNKGFTVLITDDLAENVLFMMSVGIGLGTGLIGLIIASFDPNMFADLVADDGSGGSAAGGGFLIGFLTGFLFASVIFSVVASAVNTVIVCYVEAPAEFQANHPELSNEMRAAWTSAWPELFGN